MQGGKRPARALALSDNLPRYLLFHRSPVGKSPSPFMHNTGFKLCGLPHKYTAEDTKSVERVKDLVSAVDFGGASVTIPLKEQLFSLIDERSDAVKAIGALNTIIKATDGKLIGDNTDWKGIVNPLQKLLPSSTDSTGTGLVIGAGGTARAAIYALKYLGFEGKSLVVHNPRTPAKAEALAKEFGVRASISIEGLVLGARSAVICTIPPTAKYVLTDSLLRQKPVVFEACYLPPLTPLGAAAKRHGCKQVRGLDMLIAQGVEQFQLWTGRGDASVFRGIDLATRDMYNKTHCSAAPST